MPSSKRQKAARPHTPTALLSDTDEGKHQRLPGGWPRPLYPPGTALRYPMSHLPQSQVAPRHLLWQLVSYPCPECSQLPSQEILGTKKANPILHLGGLREGQYLLLNPWMMYPATAHCWRGFPGRETPRTQSQRGASVVTATAPSVCLLADHLAHLFESSIFRAPSQTAKGKHRE